MSNVSDYSLPQAEPSMDTHLTIHFIQVLETNGVMWGEHKQLLTDIIYNNNLSLVMPLCLLIYDIRAFIALTLVATSFTVIRYF